MADPPRHPDSRLQVQDADELPSGGTAPDLWTALAEWLSRHKAMTTARATDRLPRRAVYRTSAASQRPCLFTSDAVVHYCFRWQRRAPTPARPRPRSE